MRSWERRVRPVVSRIESAQVRRTGTSVLGTIFRTKVLVLETTGRKTGRTRHTPLAYAEIADGWVISGGAGGHAQVDWIANLRAHPAARVVIKRGAHRVTAAEPVGRDYDAARDLVVARWPRVLGYEAAAGRTVPIFYLHEVDDEPTVT